MKTFLLLVTILVLLSGNVSLFEIDLPNTLKGAISFALLLLALHCYRLIQSINNPETTQTGTNATANQHEQVDIDSIKNQT